MKQLLQYTKCRLATDRWVIVLQILTVLLLFPVLYAIGMANQPELFSYVEDGLFYGTYQYSFALASSMAGGSVIGWTWLLAMRSLSRYRDRRSGIFYAMLPVGWGAKFTYHALAALVVTPLLLWAICLLNHAVWYTILVEQSAVADSQLWLVTPPAGFLTAFWWFAALFFMVGAVVRQYAWVWCVGILLLVMAGLYLEQSYTEDFRVVSELVDWAQFTLWHYVGLWSSIGLFVVVAARAVRKLEIR